ncbi:hypothetical protein SDC9_79621 [bioreactor metagenome]|uniref:Uncharacterized protein n=1 Tax=bioreactor metagenome TaxID=1076179 RepID=A0A644Z4M8_9ZZZZ
MNKGIIVNNGSINGAQVIAGDNNNITMNQNNEVILKEKENISEDVECLKNLLDDLKSELSEHKSSLDILSNKVSIIDSELEEKNPNKEKIKRYLKDSLSTVHQATGTISNIYKILEILQ